MEGLLSGNLLSKASVFGSSGGSNIKSFQSGTILPDSNLLTVTQAITAVDPSKSIVRITEFAYPYTDSSSTLNSLIHTCEITDSTTLTFKKNSNSGGRTYIYWEVIEFNNVKSKQSGSVAMATGGVVVTITEVNPLKSLLFFSVRSDITTNLPGSLFAGRINSSTQLLLGGGGSVPPNSTINWQVIEFK